MVKTHHCVSVIWRMHLLEVLKNCFEIWRKLYPFETCVCLDIVPFTQSFVNEPLAVSRDEETILQDFLVVLKRALQNYLKKCLLAVGFWTFLRQLVLCEGLCSYFDFFWFQVLEKGYKRWGLGQPVGLRHAGFVLNVQKVNKVQKIMVLRKNRSYTNSLHFNHILACE